MVVVQLCLSLFGASLRHRVAPSHVWQGEPISAELGSCLGLLAGPVSTHPRLGYSHRGVLAVVLAHSPPLGSACVLPVPTQKLSHGDSGPFHGRFPGRWFLASVGIVPVLFLTSHSEYTLHVSPSMTCSLPTRVEANLAFPVTVSISRGRCAVALSAPHPFSGCFQVLSIVNRAAVGMECS